MKYEAINPHTGERVRAFDTASRADLRGALERSERAFLAWRRTDHSARAAVLRRAAELLRGQASEHARLMAEEMGKPVSAGRGEAEKCAWVCGDPLEEGTEVGPQAREDLRAALVRQVDGSVEKGARLLTGRGNPDGPGWHYPPTVLADVAVGMPAYEQEVFGPVASIITVNDRARAIAVANDTSFGLGAAVFTADVDEGERIARNELNAGCCFVNSFVRSDPRLPFGGIMDSGYGRELGRHGIHEFVNAKTVYVG